MGGGAIGIVVSGGPAPGINSAVASVVIEGIKRGVPVKGLQNGFKNSALGAAEAIVDLSIDMVTPHALRGGSLLGTSRFNPFAKAEHLAALLHALGERGIDKLVTIGGEGSAYLSNRLSREAPHLQVVHLPKTIDNDLVLPNAYPSFGFETACFAGTNIVRTLAVDAITTNRWYLVTAMGRRSGALAIGIGLAAAATLCIIPEEFGESIRPEDVAAIILGSMEKRARAGKRFGVALLAEGLIDRLDLSGVEALKDSPRDELGRIRYSEIELSALIADPLRRLLAQRALDIKISTKNIGYELRCCDPIAFDIEYTRVLGYGAVDYLLRGATGIMIVRDFDRISAMKLEEMLDERGGMRSRSVNIESDLYHVARSYMIR